MLSDEFPFGPFHSYITPTSLQKEKGGGGREGKEVYAQSSICGMFVFDRLSPNCKILGKKVLGTKYFFLFTTFF
jgi:hypothetical protein